MHDRILPPFKTQSAGDIPGLILLGSLVIFDHRWLDNDPDLDPQAWRARARAACEELGVLAEFQVVPEADLTVIFSPSNHPSREQIEICMQAVLRHRWTDREIPSELLLKTGHEDPFDRSRARITRERSGNAHRRS
jgi:hypothetical protein